MSEWKALEDAVRGGDWSRVRALAQSGLVEWRSVRGFLEALTGSDAADLDGVLVELLAAAEADPVDAARVEAAMVWLRSLVDVGD